jgi:hypothetical protein
MNSQAIAMLIVWAIGIGVFIVALIIFRGFIQWLIGISDIIRLLEQQNALLETSAVERTAAETKDSPEPLPPTPRPNPLTRK